MSLSRTEQGRTLLKGSGIPPIVLLGLGAVCVSFAAVFVKMLKGGVLGPTVIGFWRTFFGSAALFLMALMQRSSLRIPRPVMKLSILAGFIFFLDLYFWHRSINYVGAGMATILANIQVFITAALSALIFKEHLRLGFFVAAVSAIVGVTLLSGAGSDIHFDREYIIGLVFGLLTGFVYASYLIIMKSVGHRWEHPNFVVLMAWTSLFTAVFLFAVTLLEGSTLMPPDLRSLAILVSLAVVVQAFAWWLIASNLPKLDASRSGLTLLIQPTMATLWGILFFSEQFTPLQFVGATITIVAIYAGSIRRRTGT
ncbi:MAG TPA: DMT family transporter [candidate division Zixibacteria bacterium]|nr:DMT family transporter [candidate division Zixibacteria bacterium]